VRPNGSPSDLRQGSDTLAEALAALEKGLTAYFQGEDLKVE
jgi:hypothetical protein